MQLAPGKKAPNFSLLNDKEELLTQKNFAGKNLVIYFYPKDNTPGCTTESNDFSQLANEFKKHNTEILGVSKDNIASHKKFKEKFDFPFDLLSDPDGVMCEAYGAWGEKNMYGKKYFGIIRSTFLIDTKGKLIEAWYKVKVKGHAQVVLDKVKSAC